MSSPFFSIIIPTYNRPQQLKRAITSIFNQTFTDFEILVINDGSTKYTEEYAQVKMNFSSTDKLFFFDKENNGVSSARNFGITKSKGDFICFLDDDDYYLPNHLICFHNLIRLNINKEGFYRTFASTLTGNSEEKQALSYITKDEHRIMYVLKNIVLTINICLNKSILSTYKFNETLKYGEDSELWVRILADFPLFEAHEYTTVYDRTQETASTGSLKNYFEYLKTFKLMFSNPNLKQIIPAWYKREIFEKYYSWIIANYTLNHEFLKCLKLFSELVLKTSFRFIFKTYCTNLIKCLFKMKTIMQTN